MCGSASVDFATDSAWAIACLVARARASPCAGLASPTMKRMPSTLLAPALGAASIIADAVRFVD
ncbi:MAG: hypothetical protein WKF92_13140 [Pyrinomonadaceae bacterium]